MVPHIRIGVDMRPLLIIVVTGACALSWSKGSATARPVTGNVPPPWCLPTSDPMASKLRNLLIAIGSSNENDWPTIRAANGLPVTAETDIQLIADEVVCERLSRALDTTAVEGSPLQAPVYAARFGALWAVHPPSLRGGEWGAVAFYDSTYGFRGGVAF